MKMIDLKVGMVVYDRWWPDKYGRVVKVLKTRVHINFSTDVCVYDKSHAQFLEKCETNT